MDELGISLKRVPRIKNTPCMDRANPYILNITQPNIIETGELGMYRPSITKFTLSPRQTNLSNIFLFTKPFSKFLACFLI